MRMILEYEFVQTKDITYLAFIEDSIKQNIKEYGNAAEIFKTFSEIVNTRRG